MSPELREEIAQMLGFAAGQLSDDTKLSGLTFQALLSAARKGERRGFEKSRDAAVELCEQIENSPVVCIDPPAETVLKERIRKLEWSDLPDDPKERIDKLRSEWEKA